MSCAIFSRRFILGLDVATCGEIVVHTLDHDVQDVDVHVEFSRDVASEVTCYGPVTRDVTCLLDVLHDDVSLGEAIGLDVI